MTNRIFFGGRWAEEGSEWTEERNDWVEQIWEIVYIILSGQPFYRCRRIFNVRVYVCSTQNLGFSSYPKDQTLSQPPVDWEKGRKGLYPNRASSPQLTISGLFVPSEEVDTESTLGDKGEGPRGFLEGLDTESTTSETKEMAEKVSGRTRRWVHYPET